jgi:hypothetical protein
MRVRSSRDVAAAAAVRVSSSRRSAVSRFTASRNNAAAFDPWAELDTEMAKQTAAIRHVRLKPDPTSDRRF